MSTEQVVGRIEQAAASVNRWRPVILRGALYYIIAWLTPFVGTIKAVGPNVVMQTWTAADWVLLLAECTLAGLLVIRVYIDGSFKQHTDKLDDEKKISNSAP